MSSLRNTYNKITQGINGLINLWFSIRLAVGLVSGARPYVKFGYATELSGPHDVWGAADLQATFVAPPPAGVEMQIRSDNVADVGLDVNFFYVDPQGVEQVGTVTLNGTTPVNLGVGNIRFIQRAYNSNGTKFQGRVLIEDVGTPGAGNYYASIFAEDQQTVQCQYMVPAGEVAFINNYSTAINKSGGTDASSVMRLQIQKDGKVPRTQIRYGIQRGGVSNLSSDLIIVIPVPPLSIVKVTADTSANADISAEYSMVLIKEDMIPQVIRDQY